MQAFSFRTLERAPSRESQDNVLYALAVSNVPKAANTQEAKLRPISRAGQAFFHDFARRN
jgi:hypothetical protein